MRSLFFPFRFFLVVWVHGMLQISRGSVYSLHKSSTRQYIQKVAMQQLKAKSAEVLAQLRYDLPSTFAFHKYVCSRHSKLYPCVTNASIRWCHVMVAFGLSFGRQLAWSCCWIFWCMESLVCLYACCICELLCNCTWQYKPCLYG